MSDTLPPMYPEELDANEMALFQKYNIKFRTRRDPFPESHLQSFQAIESLGETQISQYHQAANHTQHIWERFNQDQAQQLVSFGETLMRQKPAEIHWRIKIEHIVFQRFELKTDCLECKGRLWRSKLEVSTEIKGSLFCQGWLDKHRKRYSCQCSDRIQKSRSFDQNTLFCSTADEKIVHYGQPQRELKIRKPDLVFGLKPIPDPEISGSGHLLLSHQHLSPFELDRSGPYLHLPFLIVEAKSEVGSSFDFCQYQTAFPIWRFLKLQEDLELNSNMKLEEQGGPMVWFFANRGPEWRLYGCYTEMRLNGKISYNIHELWRGRYFDSHHTPEQNLSQALQLLLLVDYIFDWARDLYHPGVRQLCLKIASDRQFPSTPPLPEPIFRVPPPPSIFTFSGLPRMPLLQPVYPLQVQNTPMNPAPLENFIGQITPEVVDLTDSSNVMTSSSEDVIEINRLDFAASTSFRRRVSRSRNPSPSPALGRERTPSPTEATRLSQPLAFVGRQWTEYRNAH